jgi:ABC-type transport system involved in cytochrome c biogenesis permease subunit
VGVVEETMNRSIDVGFPLLTFGIVTGAIWANESWGNLWQWDPKENLAFVTWLCYAIYLHLRANDKASTNGLAWISIVGMCATLLTYIGVNVLNFGGLHTYGQV